MCVRNYLDSLGQNNLKNIYYNWNIITRELKKLSLYYKQTPLVLSQCLAFLVTVQLICNSFNLI